MTLLFTNWRCDTRLVFSLASSIFSGKLIRFAKRTVKTVDNILLYANNNNNRHQYRYRAHLLGVVLKTILEDFHRDIFVLSRVRQMVNYIMWLRVRHRYYFKRVFTSIANTWWWPQSVILALPVDLFATITYRLRPSRRKQQPKRKVLRSPLLSEVQCS